MKAYPKLFIYLTAFTLLLLSVSFLPTGFNLHSNVIESTQRILKDLDRNFDAEGYFDFEGFNNSVGADRLIVPNIIHYIRFNKKSFTFVEYICLRSAYIHQRPDYIFIHTDVVGGFRGKYWSWIQQEEDLQSRVIVLAIETPSDIFGQPFNDLWRFHHGSDVARIRSLMKYGGIYLDNDVYVVGNLDKYRKYEMTLGWPRNQSLGNMVIVANRNARFLSLWLDNYRDYKKDLWYHNSGDYPTKEYLMKRPELVHRVEHRFGTEFLMREIYQLTNQSYQWRKELDTIHLLINHRSYLDVYFKDYHYFNERNIVHYPFNFGEMARFVLNYPSNGN